MWDTCIAERRFRTQKRKLLEWKLPRRKPTQNKRSTKIFCFNEIVSLDVSFAFPLNRVNDILDFPRGYMYYSAFYDDIS